MYKIRSYLLNDLELQTVAIINFVKILSVKRIYGRLNLFVLVEPDYKEDTETKLEIFMIKTYNQIPDGYNIVGKDFVDTIIHNNESIHIFTEYLGNTIEESEEDIQTRLNEELTDENPIYTEEEE